MVQNGCTNFLKHPSPKPNNKIKPKLIVTKTLSSAVVNQKVKINNGAIVEKIFIYLNNYLSLLHLSHKH